MIPTSDMPRILILDTYYPEFLSTLPVPPADTYALNLRNILDLGFGTADFYSKYLNAFGWVAEDVITNFTPLQNQWAYEHGLGYQSTADEILLAQIEAFKPDVLFFQSLSILVAHQASLKQRYIMACQCSCAVRTERMKNFHILFTSFPHYVHTFRRQGVKVILNPLAFEPSVLDSVPPSLIRIHDITFVGGVGEPGRTHWVQGIQTLEAVAREFPTFKWWGYGNHLLPQFSPLQAHYQGSAWGHEMFRIYANSKIVLNRHGEISHGYSNNMRMYEATGCGALLMTEASSNLNSLFYTATVMMPMQPTAGQEVVDYSNIPDLIKKLHYFLEHSNERVSIADNGQSRTLTEHTYHHRMCTVSDELMELLP